jgi:hypothetical protein
MKIPFIILAMTTTLVIGCTKNEKSKGTTPQCITDKIQAFQIECCDQGANVKQYQFQGAPAYVFDPGTCGADMTSEVIGEDCITLGHLGGIAGNIVINGGSFEAAQLQATIWQQ